MAKRRVVMFFLFGLSGVFHVFCKFQHNIGERATKAFQKELVSIDCIISVSHSPNTRQTTSMVCLFSCAAVRGRKESVYDGNNYEAYSHCERNNPAKIKERGGKNDEHREGQAAGKVRQSRAATAQGTNGREEDQEADRRT